MIGRVAALSVLLLLSQIDTALAHHSHGNYKINEAIQVQGVVKEFHLANPHVWVFVSVENEQGVVEDWALEGGGRAGFVRQGTGI